MKAKQYLFIYDRKEMLVLLVLFLMVALFSFTMGVHLGKRLGLQSNVQKSEEISTAHAVADEIPTRPELVEMSKGTDQAIEETLNQELHKEVTRSGITLNSEHPTHLPKTPESTNAGATTLHSEKADSLDAHGKYTLQIGSFPSLKEAKKHMTSLQRASLKPFLHEAEVKGKGKWYRVYIGSYMSKQSAEQAGMKYKQQHVIPSFIVTNLSG